MRNIEKAVVIGAGTMGSGIAAHLANAGISVALLDIVAEGAGNRNAVAEGALERLRRSTPPAFMHPDNAALVTPGNVEDHLHRVADADWIAEAVVERVDVKRALYAGVDEVRTPGSFVTSNTSTIPLARLTAEMPDRLARDFCITHFFNPVRYMRLLEMVAGPRTRAEVVETLTAFCDTALGKGVVHCKDTPGFLANRIGVFALQTAVVEAASAGLSVEEADALVGRPMGIPKTGVFGLYDLIGLDLMLDVADSLRDALPTDDAFHDVAGGIPLVRELVARGCTGSKGGAGFYREREGEGEAVREAIDLVTGEYRRARRPELAAAAAGESRGLPALVAHSDRYGEFARRVLVRTLGYAASLVPDVCEEIVPVDEAMKLGYNWQRGPFEMIDELGAAWLQEALQAEGARVPPILGVADSAALYRAADGELQRLGLDGAYAPVRRAPGVVRLSDITRVSKPVAHNAAASLWDVGDGVACVEFHTKANALTPESMALLRESVDLVPDSFRALVIHSDAPHFSVGFNLELVLESARQGAWDRIDTALREFHGACLAIKYASFPVVGAPAGMSLGGGFEVLLHSDAVQAHANTVMGLVETIVGLVPSGGGCKELLLRWTGGAGGSPEALSGALKVFELIGMGTTASSPLEAAPYRFFLPTDRAAMNRDRLLAEAKARAIELAEGYTAPPPATFTSLGPAGMEAMHELLDDLEGRGIATTHDAVVGRHLANVLCGGGAPAGEAIEEEEMCRLEREGFIALLHTEATLARIEHMLAHGRPLRN